jgi:hypothetical protein
MGPVENCPAAAISREIAQASPGTGNLPRRVAGSPQRPSRPGDRHHGFRLLPALGPISRAARTNAAVATKTRHEEIPSLA